MLGYEYNSEGRNGKPRTINNRGQLLQFINDVVKPAMKEKREIRITNLSDEMLFHCQSGKIIFDGKTLEEL